MDYDFDAVIERRGGDSLKWNKYAGRDVIPMWVADMDFAAPECVLDAVRERAAHGVLGYGLPPEEVGEVIVERMARLYGWAVRQEWIVWLPGLVPALHVVCRAYAAADEEVLTMVPIYPPFLSAPRLSGRQLVRVAMAEDGGRYTVDLAELDRQVSEKSKVLLYCNPHNPVGRVYSREDVRAVAEFCVERGLVLCSDEIHCDLLLDEVEHVPAATISEAVAQNTITLMAPSKTFNTPGLNCAFAIIPNGELRRAFKRCRDGIVPHPNVLGYAACLAAFRDGEPWRRALIDYLRGNRDLLEKVVAEEMTGVSMGHVEATYLAWLKVDELGRDDPGAFFEQAGVGLQDGKMFGQGGYLRLNFGCRRELLQTALGRMLEALK